MDSQELENDGYGLYSSIADLTEALSKATGKPFAFAQHSGQQLGGDEIRSAILYNTQNISSIGPALTIAGPPFDRLNRPPLLQSFSINRGADIDQTLHIVVNHFKSKGGCPTKTATKTLKLYIQNAITIEVTVKAAG